MDLRTDNGTTPLHEASQGGHVEMVMYLLDNGADISARHKYGATALYEAVLGGHAMVVALLLNVTATGLTGLALYAGQYLSGPLAPLMGGMGGGWAHTLEEVHEVLANLTLLLVALHLGGVALSSLQHRENLVRSMITGYKRSESP